MVIDPGGWRRQPEEVPWLPVVRAAVWADRRLRLRYRPSGGPAARDYTVDPYGLLAKAGVWYLIAAHRGRARIFRVSGAERAIPTDAAAGRPAALDLEALWRRLRAELEDPPAATAVTLRVRAARTAMRLRISPAELAGPPGEPVDDGAGWDRLVLPFRAVAAARGVLLGLGTDVEVVAPPEFRAEMAATALPVVRPYGLRKRASRKQKAPKQAKPRAAIASSKRCRRAGRPGSPSAVSRPVAFSGSCLQRGRDDQHADDP